MFAKLRNIILPLGFILIFFLPYIMGTRLRPEIPFLYLCIPLWFIIRRKANFTERRILAIACSAAIFSILCVLVGRSGKLLPDIILWTNLNFIFLSTCAFMVFKPWLMRTRHALLIWFIVISIAINIIAYLQFQFPELPLHNKLFSLYGGYVNDPSKRAGFITNAEFQVVAAKRYTSIFIGMHVLALFNVVVIGLCLGLLLDRTIRKSILMRIVCYTSLVLGLTGGVLSASKTFYFTMFSFGAAMLLLERNGKRWIVYITITFLLCVVVVYVADLAGSKSAISRILRTTLSLDASKIVGSRYSEQGYLHSTVRAITGNRELFMFGRGGNVAGLKMADSLFIPPFVVGGVIFFVLYVMQILLLIKVNFDCRRESYLLKVFFALNASFLIAGIGIPTYQVGRIAPLLVILNLCFLGATQESTNPDLLRLNPSRNRDFALRGGCNRA